MAKNALASTILPWHIAERDFPRQGSVAEQLRFLLQYAILAPSSHNTQPWKFRVEANRIEIYADLERWLRVLDADRRELYISIGCALENLVVAGEHFGFSHELSYFPQPNDERLAVTVTLLYQGEPLTARDAKLFDAITRRQTSHRLFQERAVPPEIWLYLQGCLFEPDVYLDLTDDEQIKQAVQESVVRADAIQFADPAFREELGYWIGQGVFGTPWLLAKLGQFAVTHLDVSKDQAKKDVSALKSAPLIGILCTQQEDHAQRIKVGQIYARLALLATNLGLAMQPMSQVLEVAELKTEVGRLLPDRRWIPQHLFRIGYAATESEHMPRRALQDVLL